MQTNLHAPQKKGTHRVPFFLAFGGDSNNQMQQFGELLLDAGLTASTHPFSPQVKMQTNLHAPPTTKPTRGVVGSVSKKPAAAESLPCVRGGGKNL